MGTKGFVEVEGEEKIPKYKIINSKSICYHVEEKCFPSQINKMQISEKGNISYKYRGGQCWNSSQYWWGWGMM